jgi:hypothetical protein
MPYEFFPQEVIDLQKELHYKDSSGQFCHEELIMELLATPVNTTVDDKLTLIATYCEVVLDGVYDNVALLKLIPILIRRLESKRTGIVFASADTLSNLQH